VIAPYREVDRPQVPTVLRLPRPIAEQLLAHARSELPNEACGLLSGRLASAAVTRYHPARNARQSPWRFDIDAVDLVRLVLGIEDAGEELVAAFHSHTRTDAVPSATDVREAHYPVIHLIASLADPAEQGELRAWRIADGRSSEVTLRVG
jgi:proteasome lid subunit RPN8/RPN11